MSSTKTEQQFHTVLIVGPGMWGRGSDLAEAKVEFKARHGYLNRPHLIFRFPEGVEFAGVDDGGGIYWKYTDEDNPVQPVRSEHRFPKSKD